NNWGAVHFPWLLFYVSRASRRILSLFKILLGVIGLPLIKAAQPNKEKKYITLLLTTWHPFILFDNPDILI
ncbi:hypothetical protein J7E95_01070, partial [Streptomyces sp. ISL-14]|nr:hypothetical protein [Streptomyces sp. ISL-14]